MYVGRRLQEVHHYGAIKPASIIEERLQGHGKQSLWYAEEIEALYRKKGGFHRKAVLLDRRKEEEMAVWQVQQQVPQNDFA